MLLRSLLLSLFTFSLFLSSAQTFHPEHLDGSLLIRTKPSYTKNLALNYQSDPQFKSLIASFQIDSVARPFIGLDQDLDRTYRIYFSNISATDILKNSLSSIDYIELVEAYPLFTTGYITNDMNPAQYGLNRINAQLAWDISKGDSNIRIAIVDNAVLHTHEDLIENRWQNDVEFDNLFDDDLNGYTNDFYGYDVADGDNDPTPPLGTTQLSDFVHGTHCAGIAAATTDNLQGVSSIGFNCEFISVKCTPDLSPGNILTHAYEGITYAINAEADIISMSWGGGNSATGQAIVLNAASRDIVLIAAAGNDNTDSPQYPAAYADVLSVGSTDATDTKSSFSNFGFVDVMAPGSAIYSTVAGNNSSYGTLSGTSMSCPLVAGLAGLILAHDPSLSANEVKDKIIAGCENIDAQNPDFIGELGAGRINAFNSLNGGALSIQESENSIKLFPNPTRDLVNLQLENASKAIIYNPYGQAVQELFLNSGLNSISLKNLSPGIYSIRLVESQTALTFMIL